MLPKSTVEDILTAAAASGADLAEIFCENTEQTGISMVNGLVEKANWGIDSGLGLRLICGHMAIYAYTNRLDYDSLIRLAKETASAASAVGTQCAVSADTAATVGTWRAASAANNRTWHAMSLQVDKRRIVEHLRTASSAAYGYNSLITQAACFYSATVQDVLIANSAGIWAEDRRIRTRVSLSAVASSASEKQTGRRSPGAGRGYEFVEGLDMAALGRDAAETAVTMLNAQKAPGGIMPVIIENGFGGVIFHEACAHSLEATAVAKGASVFADKLGRQIASPLITAIDDGTLPGEWGSTRIDDEGNPNRRRILIENGILKSYMVDELNGRKMNTPATGSARRESYKFAPTSRMSNTYIAAGAPGISTRAEIIADTDRALYAKRMGGGSVNPATGEFNFAVEEGYLVRDGKICEPVRGATLIGKGERVLMLIDKVGDNLELAPGVCGSVSGGVPTSVGQPTIRVTEMLVGGGQ